MIEWVGSDFTSLMMRASVCIFNVSVAAVG
jgi:hypothetical protein